MFLLHLTQRVLIQALIVVACFSSSLSLAETKKQDDKKEISTPQLAQTYLNNNLSNTDVTRNYLPTSVTKLLKKYTIPKKRISVFIYAT